MKSSLGNSLCITRTQIPGTSWDILYSESLYPIAVSRCISHSRFLNIQWFHGLSLFETACLDRKCSFSLKNNQGVKLKACTSAVASVCSHLICTSPRSFENWCSLSPLIRVLRPLPGSAAGRRPETTDCSAALTKNKQYCRLFIKPVFTFKDNYRKVFPLLVIAVRAFFA